MTGGSLAVLAIPVVEGFIVWRSTRPTVPGPYDQDGFGDGEDHPGEQLTVVWLGDSLASGIGAASADASFPRKAVALFGAAEKRNVHLTCLARPGSQAADVLADQVPSAVDHLGPGAIAVVTVGANDVGTTGPWQFSRTYTAILVALAGTGATVICVGLPNMGAAAVIPQPLRAIAGWVGRTATRRIRTLAATHGAHFVNIDLRPERGTDSLVYLAADKWHPNDDTYGLWAGSVAALLNLILLARVTVL